MLEKDKNNVEMEQASCGFLKIRIVYKIQKGEFQ